MINSIKIDLPQQFKDKPKINAIVTAIDEQITELKETFESLRNDRNLNTAVGKQLDFLGNNIGLTRAKALNIMGESLEISDELYRNLLRHKAYRNSNSCTYYDLMQELSVILGDVKIYYEEDKNIPATIILKASGDLGQVPASAPAGVNVVYQNDIGTEINYIPRIATYEYDVPKCGTFRCGTRRT